MRATKWLGAGIVAAGLAAATVGQALPSSASAFPGRNGHIVFGRNDSAPDIATEQGTVVAGSSDTEVSPAWDPIHNRIAYQRLLGQQFDIFVQNVTADGQPVGAPVNVTNNPAQDQRPTWSPDGRRIAFDTNRDGDFEVYSMNSNGTQLINVSHDAEMSDARPTYSPRDGSIVWNRARGSDRPDLVMGAESNTGAATQLTNTPNLSETEPNFSPDGSSVIYTARTSDNRFAILRARLTSMTSPIALVAFSTRLIGGPKCSPDGRSLLFSALGSDDLNRILRVSCTRRVRAAFVARGFGPDWQRLPA